MKELRDLKDLTIHDVQPISDEYASGISSRQVFNLYSREFPERMSVVFVYQYTW